MTKTIVDIDVIAKAVELACRAPSIHNSQPWRWVATRTAAELFLDPHRVVHSHDSVGREAIISCGAVLDHFRIAMAAAGWTTNIEQFPDPNNLDHLASIDFAPLDRITEVWREGADAILLRRTDRLPFRAPRDWEAFEPVLRSTVDNDLVTLDVLAEDMRSRLAEASRLTDVMRRDDDSYHRELQWWTAPFRMDEGVPRSALISDSERQRVEVNRSFPPGGHGDRRGATPQDEAKILVLSTPEDSGEDALNCGRVLSTVLLDCTIARLATCTLTHITELEASRDIIRDLIGTASYPQVLIRVGSVTAVEQTPAPTPRRPLLDVLEIRP
jgi:hypothetical protein